MEKTANQSRVLMYACDKHLLFFAVIPLFLLHQNLRLNRVSVGMGAVPSFFFFLIEQNNSNRSDGCGNSIHFVNFGVKEIKE